LAIFLNIASHDTNTDTNNPKKPAGDELAGLTV
jgi:hypothetical protein